MTCDSNQTKKNWKDFGPDIEVATYFLQKELFNYLEVKPGILQD